jgi:hypothetical protein
MCVHNVAIFFYPDLSTAKRPRTDLHLYKSTVMLLLYWRQIILNLDLFPKARIRLRQKSSRFDWIRMLTEGYFVFVRYIEKESKPRGIIYTVKIEIAFLDMTFFNTFYVRIRVNI